MNILVTGGSGFLGKKITRILGQTHTIIPIYWTHEISGGESADITDSYSFESVFFKHKIDAVIHTAALRNPDYCEKNKVHTFSVNVQGTQIVSNIAEKHGAKLIYISTDYVFDGKKPPFRETDEPNPINYYGVSKLAGERLVEQVPGSLIVRIPLLYGFNPVKEDDTMMVKYLKVIKTPQVYVADNFVVRVPTLTDDVAKALGFLIDKNTQGIIHLSSGSRHTRYEMLKMVADGFGLLSHHIKPSDSILPETIKRPFDSELDASKYRLLGGHEFTQFDKGVQMMRIVFEKSGVINEL